MSFKALAAQYAAQASESRKRKAHSSEGDQSKALKRSEDSTGLLFTHSFLISTDSTGSLSQKNLVETVKSLLSKVSGGARVVENISDGEHSDWDATKSHLLVRVITKECIEEVASLIARCGTIKNDSEKFVLQRVVDLGSDMLPETLRLLTKTVVVARYKEDVEWIPSHWGSIVVIYNKGPRLSSDTPGTVLTLDNVGRESHTYLTHIIDNYDNLSDVVYFSQGYPFDHSPQFVDCVDNNVGLCAPFQPCGNVSAIVRDHNVEYYERQFPGIQAGFDRTVERLFGKEFRRPLITFTPGAVFAVQKARILKREKAFYEKALSLLAYDVNPIEGYAFERLWAIIFE